MSSFLQHAIDPDANSVEQGEFFYSLIKLIKAKVIVEIGVDWGSTTRYLCQAALEVGGKVYGYDGWSDYGPNLSWHHSGSKEKITELLKSNNFDNFELHQVNTLTPEFKTFFDNKHNHVDFAFIDADHSYQGIKNDFDIVYPHMSDTGVIAFHDTLRIDGCREFIIDLRTIYNNGTFDVIDFPFGNRDRRVGITLLVKRSYPLLGLEIDEICGSISSKEEIYDKEKRWLSDQMNLSKSSTR